MAESATDTQLYSDIVDSLSDALKGMDEAYGIATSAWKESDKRSKEILSVWAEVETLFQEFLKKL